MGDLPPLIGNPYNGYINPYYWVDDHPLYGNNGSLDPGTYSLAHRTGDRLTLDSSFELKLILGFTLVTLTKGLTFSRGFPKGCHGFMIFTKEKCFFPIDKKTCFY